MECVLIFTLLVTELVIVVNMIFMQIQIFVLTVFQLYLIQKWLVLQNKTSLRQLPSSINDAKHGE